MHSTIQPTRNLPVRLSRRYGIAKETMQLLSTGLEIKKGQRVSCIPANNQPDKTQYFAMPIRGIWEKNGRKWKDTESGILVKRDEIEWDK